MPAMPPEAFVAALYAHILRRAPDPIGLAAQVAHLQATGDYTAILAALLESDEYRARFAATGFGHEALARCLDLLGGRPLFIVDVGAQMLTTEAHVYDPLRRADILHHIIGFEPLAEKLAARSAMQGADNLTLLPYAVGDGSAHRLHVNNDDATSSLFPLNEHLCADFEHLHDLRTVSTLPVETQRLDTVLPDDPVDFLKLDIQGAELLALQGAIGTLARTNVLHCEVEFAPIYAGQPLFGEVEAFLRPRGFALIDLIVPHRYAYRNASGIASPDRLLWGEAVFFREGTTASDAAAQALIAALVYGKHSLAQACLEAAQG